MTIAPVGPFATLAASTTITVYGDAEADLIRVDYIDVCTETATTTCQ